MDLEIDLFIRNYLEEGWEDNAAILWALDFLLRFAHTPLAGWLKSAPHWG